MGEPATGAPLTARRAQTQDKLMIAAVGVFASRGILGASVEEICEAAGFTRGAFYSNFADKDALVLALLKSRIERQFEALAALPALSQRRQESLDTLIGAALDLVQGASDTDPESIFVQQELQLYAARQPGVRRSYAAYAEQCHTRLRTLVAQLLADIGQEFSIELDDAVTLCTAAHSHAHLAAALDHSTPDLRALHVLIRTITRPIGSPDHRASCT